MGEKVKFLVTLTKDGQPVTSGVVTYTIDKDGMPPVTPGKLNLGAGPLCVEGTLAEPGFLRCRVSYAANRRNRFQQSLEQASIR